ncbi:MAG: oligosaccharide flippase family protein [Synergistes sp.]|nr:oligosaccharide flippase family protein [Synergistes sp.]
MSKFRLFVENFLVYGFGGIISHVIPLLMLPIVTRLMPNTSYYGINDLTGTIVSIATYISIMGMYDAMYRMYFEKSDEAYKKTVCSTTFIFTLGVSAFVSALLVLFRDRIAEMFYTDHTLAYLLFFAASATLVGATNSIISAPTRMQNRRRVFLITNTIGPILAYSVCIPLLLKGYYMTALPTASLVSSAILEIVFWKLNREWFSLKLFDKKMLRQLLTIAIPLIPNFLIYWIFNSSDKIMITNIIGTEQTGIYSVGAKLGHASQLIYMAFAGGWQFFAFSTMKEEQQVRNNSLIFEYLGVISFAASAFICAISYTFYAVVFPKAYLPGFIIAPYLFLAPLLLMLFQVIVNQFLVVKKTWPTMFILLTGALLNVGLNLLLIPKFGIEGAAVATLAGYILSDIVCAAVLIKMKLMILSVRFVISSILIVGYFILWRAFFTQNMPIGILSASVLCASFAYLYRQDIKMLLYNIKS